MKSFDIVNNVLIINFAFLFSDVFAFAPQYAPSVTTDLSAMKNEDLYSRMAGGAAVILTGIGAAAQIAFADPDIAIANGQLVDTNPSLQNVIQQESLQATSITLSAFGAPSSGSSAYETLDFSMPSYKDGGSSTDSSAPAFAPKFDDDAPVAKKEEPVGKSDAEKKAEARREKEEKQKAEEEAKAAAQKKKEERLAEQKAKMEEMARRTKEAEEAAKAQKAAAEEAKATAAPTPAPVSPPAKVEEKIELPKIEAPKFDAPKFDAPKFEAPKFDAPKFEAPKFDAPKFDVPKFDAPKFDTPKFDAPKFDAPKFDTPKFDAPKFDTPKFDTPKFDTPKFDTPKFDTPKFDTPKLDLDLPSFKEEVDPNLEPQEVRDEKARELATEFKELQGVAKAKSKEAREARKEAEAAKKIAKAAKDEACKTRFGGKILCIRSFGSGY